MNAQTTQTLHLFEVRQLAKTKKARMIGRCLKRALLNKSNGCYSSADPEDVITVLAKAHFVSQHMQRGLSLAHAMRELGNRMRSVVEFQHGR